MRCECYTGRLVKDETPQATYICMYSFISLNFFIFSLGTERSNAVGGS